MVDPPEFEERMRLGLAALNGSAIEVNRQRKPPRKKRRRPRPPRRKRKRHAET